MKPSNLLHYGKMPVPWNAAWSSEMRYELRPCRWVNGKCALWQPHTPGEGVPMFAQPHNVRQRRSITEMRCTVCGEKTPANDRWWFRLGRVHLDEGLFMTTEAPVHRDCAVFAALVCPHLQGRQDALERLPTGYMTVASIIGGPKVDQDFGINIDPSRQKVIGALKLAWPLSQCSFL